MQSSAMICSKCVQPWETCPCEVPIGHPEQERFIIVEGESRRPWLFYKFDGAAAACNSSGDTLWHSPHMGALTAQIGYVK